MTTALWFIFGLLVLSGWAFGKAVDQTNEQLRRANDQLSDIRELLRGMNSHLSSIEFYTENMPKAPSSDDWGDI